MPIHSRCPILLAALLWAAAALAPAGLPLAVGPLGPSHALARASALQPPPQPIDRLANKTTPLSNEEQNQVAAYVEYWLKQLETGEPEQVKEAVRKIQEPLGAISVTRLFRDEYSRAAIHRLEEALVRTTSNEVAVNIMKVGAAFGTERALRMMVERSDPARESRAPVRLWAARGFQVMVETDGVAAGQLTGRLARAAESEENWLVLRRQFEALAAAPDSLNHQIAVLVAATKRMAEDEEQPNAMMESVHRALVLLRNQWIHMDMRQRQQFAPSAGPAIVRVLEVADAHWAKAQEHERARGWYRSAVQAAESLLITIDLQVRSNRQSVPETQLDTAWRQRTHETYKQHLRTWQEIVGRAPYQQPPRQ